MDKLKVNLRTQPEKKRGRKPKRINDDELDEEENNWFKLIGKFLLQIKLIHFYVKFKEKNIYILTFNKNCFY